MDTAHSEANDTCNRTDINCRHIYLLWDSILRKSPRNRFHLLDHGLSSLPCLTPAALGFTGTTQPVDLLHDEPLVGVDAILAVSSSR